MPTNTAETRQKRHKLLLEARTLIDAAETAKRPLTAEERVSYNKIWADQEAVRLEIEEAERRNALERAEAEMEFLRLDEEKRAITDNTKAPRKPARPWESPEYRSAFGSYLTGRPTAEEHRALTAGTGTQGGYLYAPEVFVNELLKSLTDATIFRTMARVLPPIIGADSLGVPVLTSRMSAAEWTSELGKPSRDTSLAFGKRALTPHPLAKEVPVSKVLLRKVPAAEGLVRDELSRVAAEAMENAYMTGDGVQKPLGIFTASADGISTSRDVATGNTASSVTFDGLKSAKYELKQGYWAGAQWLMHRDIMEMIAKLKDGNGRYLLQDSVVADEPDRLVGFPVRLSEYAPSTIGSGKYVGAFGNFAETYWIVDSIDMEIQRLEELLARENQDLFIIRMMSDGAPVREESIVRVTLG